MYKIGIVVLITAAFISFSSCTENTKKETNAKIDDKVLNENFDWLLGNWKKNNETEGKETFEVWHKINSNEYAGLGFTMQQNDTLKQEKIQLVKLNEKWVLKVQPQDEPESITFNMTSYNEQEFICENKELDFPKLIKYWKNDDKLKALVSGDDMEIAFEFEIIDK